MVANIQITLEICMETSISVPFKESGFRFLLGLYLSELSCSSDLTGVMTVFQMLDTRQDVGSIPRPANQKAGAKDAVPLVRTALWNAPAFRHRMTSRLFCSENREISCPIIFARDYIYKINRFGCTQSRESRKYFSIAGLSCVQKGSST